MQLIKENIHAVIFDYGGTLDTDGRHWAHVIWEGYRHNTVPVSEEDFRTAYVHGERTLAKQPIIKPEDNFLVLLQKKTDIQLRYLAEQNILSLSAAEQSRLTDGISTYCYDYALRHVTIAREVLTTLKEKYRLVLVSNFYGNIHTILRDFRIDLFESIIESAVVGVRKPDPAIYRMGVAATGYPAEQVVVIGDSFSKDIVPATEVGCPTIQIKGEGWTQSENNHQGATHTIETLREVLRYL